MVFEYCIRYFKKCVHQEIEKIQTLLEDYNDDIKYVFTVPEIKGGEANLLMREAAVKVLYLSIQTSLGISMMACFFKYFIKRVF